MIKQMVLEFTHTQMEPIIQDIGKMTHNMVKEKSFGQMEASILVIIIWVKSMVRVYIGGLMGVIMMELGMITK